MLLCMCCCCAVLHLLCPRYVFAADAHEHGYYVSQPLSGMCLRILKLKSGSLCFGSCTSTAIDCSFASRRRSRARVVFVLYAPGTLCCCLLVLSLLRQRNRRRFVLSTNLTDRCSTKRAVSVCMQSTSIPYGRRAFRTWYTL